MRRTGRAVGNIHVLRAVTGCTGQGFGPVPADARVNIHPMRPGSVTAIVRTGPKRNMVLPDMAITAPWVRKNLVNLRPQRQARTLPQSRALRCGGTVLGGDQAQTYEQAKTHAFHGFRSGPAYTNAMCLFMGSSRTRTPLAAKIALASAGGAAGTGGSPTPRMSEPLSTVLTMISGA